MTHIYNFSNHFIDLINADLLNSTKYIINSTPLGVILFGGEVLILAKIGALAKIAIPLAQGGINIAKMHYEKKFRKLTSERLSNANQGIIDIKDILNITKNDLDNISENINSIGDYILKIENIMNVNGLIGLSNLGLAGINAGIGIAGFSIINKKLEYVSEELELITSKVENIELSEKQNLIEKSRKFIESVEHTTYLLNEGINDNLNNTVTFLLSESYSFIDSMIQRFKKDLEISLPIDYILLNYISHIYLLRTYLKSLHLAGKDISKKDILTSKVEKLKNELLSQKFTDTIYEMLVINSKNVIEEEDVDIIVNMYKISCIDNFNKIESTKQLLLSMSPKEYNELNKKIESKIDSCLENNPETIIINYDEI